jgi:hypothetical protein
MGRVLISYCIIADFIYPLKKEIPVLISLPAENEERKVSLNDKPYKRESAIISGVILYFGRSLVSHVLIGGGNDVHVVVYLYK